MSCLHLSSGISEEGKEELSKYLWKVRTPNLLPSNLWWLQDIVVFGFVNSQSSKGSNGWKQWAHQGDVTHWKCTHVEPQTFHAELSPLKATITAENPYTITDNDWTMLEHRLADFGDKQQTLVNFSKNDSDKGEIVFGNGYSMTKSRSFLLTIELERAVGSKFKLETLDL